MFSRRLIFAAGYIAFFVQIHVLLVLFSLNCCSAAVNDRNSCGDIHNISFPFRLKAHPLDHCEHWRFELDCENNRTILYLFSGKYFVQKIDYVFDFDYGSSGTISLVDVGIQRNNCSSVPLHSLTPDNFTSYGYLDPLGDPYGINWNQFAVFVSCEKPLKSSRSSLIYIDTNNSSCSASSSSKKHSYVVVGDISWSGGYYYFGWSDVGNLCSVDMIYPVRHKKASNILDVHNLLADGFDLVWYFDIYNECGRGAGCFNDTQNVTSACIKDSRRLNGISAFLDGLRRFFKGDFRYFFKRGLRYYMENHFGYDFKHNLPLALKIIGGIISPRILLALCAFAFLIRNFRRRHLSMFDSIEGYLRSQNHLMPISYSYSDIKKMTKGFKDKLGEGGYGAVYKGKLRSGHFVAIKVLSKPKANGQEFINEVATIGRIHHVNVVKLIGYCAERSKRALVYDFMPNGSLEKYIFSQEENISLSCKQMYEISQGVARGIEYLHRGCDMQILHFDIKPHNILLDENFTPKVSDFGLAKLYPTDDSIVTITAARGTMGYMAPELFYKNIGGISYKADVYSFGMLLMEMTGRRRNLNAFADHTSQIYFPSWIYDQFKEGRKIEMGETCEEERVMAKKMVIVSLWCIQMKPNDRPSMNKVVEMLEGDIEHLQMPPKPFLCPQEVPAEDHGVDMNPSELPTLSSECINSITLDVSEP